MIKCELKQIITQQQKSLKQIRRATGIRMGTLCGLANGNWKSLPDTVLDRLCEYLGTTPADLLVYQPGEAAVKE